MRKKEFVRLLSELVAIKKAEDKLAQAYKEFEPDIERFGHFRYEDLVVNTPMFAMDDTDKWIQYWLYDLDCGERTDLTVTDGERIVPLKTPGQLYDWFQILIKNNKKTK